MAGTAFIAPGTTWHVGSHAFLPIVERLRAAYGSRPKAEEIFSPIDEGFEFMTLDELSAEEFRDFEMVSRSGLDSLNTDQALPSGEREFLASAWSELQRLLALDPRSGADTHGMR
jgi:hypothetical protein